MRRIKKGKIFIQYSLGKPRPKEGPKQEKKAEIISL